MYASPSASDQSDSATGPIDVLYVGDVDGGASVEAALARRTDRFEIVTATSVDEALTRTAGDRIDCVVSERAVPGGDGIDLLRTVREERDDLPFVLVGTNGPASDVDEAFEAGVTDYVPGCREPERSTLLANRIEVIVERARAKRTTETRTRRLETVISNIPGVVYRCHNEPEWPMEFVRGECEELTGYPAAALESGDVVWGTDLVHPADREPMWEAVQEALAADESFEVTYRIVGRDGTTRWMWERGRGVNGNDGDLAALEGFITDITERKTHERELASLHEASRELVAAETPSDVVRITLGAAETILAFANTAVRVVGDDGEMLCVAETTDGSVSHAGDRPDYRVDGDTPVARAYRAGEPVVVDDLRQLDDRYDRGSLRSAAYVPIGKHGVVTVANTEPAAFDDQDVEAVSLLARLAAAALARIQSRADLQAQNERLEEFASIVSHDLRNPLNVAEGRVTLARGECESDHLAHVATAHRRMRTLIEDLLALAREGEAVTDVEPIDLGRLFETEWIHVDTGDATSAVETDRVVRADRNQLRRLLANLVRNSVEHGSTNDRAGARSDGASVRIEIGDVDGGFYVEDDGPGIPRDRRERVFEAGHTTSDSGTGFGLAIVERIADAHGWTVSLSEGTDGGARFEFTGVDVSA